MKTITLFVMLLLSLSTFASTAEMNKLIRLVNGNFYATNLPSGYRAEKLLAAPLTANLKAYLAQKTQEKKVQWREYVMESDEFSSLSRNERRVVAANPWKELGVKYLLEISEVYAIYKGSKLIGYFMDISDHVQAAIYQDGAWIDAFFNPELTLVKAFDESA
jgi:hypothetical protein